MADTKIRLRVVSCLTDPEGELHETKHARHGLLRETPAGLEIEYDDEQDGSRAHVTLRCEGRGAQMLRRGEMSGRLRFEPGERIASSYVTMYGEIPVAVDTHAVELTREGRGGELYLAYDVYIAGEISSRAEMRICWKA